MKISKDLRQYISHKLTCPAINRSTCRCGHAWTQHFQWGPYPCAHCSGPECKMFRQRDCNCGLSKILKENGIKEEDLR